MMLLKILICFQITHILSISVDPSNGTDNSDCFKGITPCKHLEFVFENGAQYINNSEIVLYDGVHSVTKEIQLMYHTNFTLKSASSATINCTTKNAGFTFIYANLFKLEHIQVQNCGVIHNGTTVISNETQVIVKNPKVHIAFCFIYSQAIYINNCTFVNNNGIGVALYNVNRTIDILNSLFQSNSNHEDFKPDRFISGGGVYIEYTKCHGLEHYPCLGHLNYNKNTEILISDCIFEHNIADHRYEHSEPETPLDKTYITFGKGGGISINVFENAENNDFDIKGCTFSNNSAMWGAGVSVTFKDQSQSNSVNVLNSTFSFNKATYAGGGVTVQSLYIEDFDQEFFFKNTTTVGNIVNIHNSSFCNSSAIWGGGISITATTRVLYSTNSSSRDVLIENCKFKSNHATIGYAVGLKTINLNKDIIGPGMSYRVRFKNSIFDKNYMILTEDKKVIGHGALYSDKVTLIFDGENRFQENNYTAVVLESSSLLFDNYSVTMFVKNQGFEGGAIALFGMSWVMLGFNSQVTFNENTAASKGGAIYVRSGGPPRIAFKSTAISSSQCFIRYIDTDVKPNSWPVKVSFIGNNSPNGTGNSVYASTLQHCRKDGESRELISALDWTPFSYINSSNNQSEIVTNAIELSVNLSQWSAYPYLPFSPDILLRDEKNQSVYGSVKLSVESFKNPVRLDPPNNIFLIRNKLARLRLVGKTKSNYTFRFATTGGQLFESEQFQGKLKICPPGFRPDFDSDKCICMDGENGDVISCYENGTVYILKGKWGYIDKNDNVLKTVPCPKHQCKCKNNFANYLCQLDIDDQCINNRTGMLCGSCDEGLSVLLGNEGCGKCTNTNIFIIGSILIVAMFIFIILISYFELDAFSGYLNGFFYSYQMISLLITQSMELDYAISFIIGLLSFSGTGNNIGICLFNGMDNLSKLAINYVLPGLAILITFFIGMWVPRGMWNKLFCNKDNEDDDVRKYSFGRAFSFISVLCYSSITETTFRLFHYVIINGDYIVYNAAPTVYFGKVHIYFGIGAIFCTIIIIIGFPALLVFQSYFTNKFQIFIKIDPIVEALKNCFKPNYRPFAAFYFACRVVLLLLGSVIQEEVQKLIVLTCCCVIILVIFAYVQPYERWTYNFFDVLLLTNLTLISLLSIVLCVPFAMTDSSRINVTNFCHVLVWLPVVIAILRLFWYFLLRSQRIKRKGTIDSEEGETPQTCYRQLVYWVRNSTSQVVQVSNFPIRVLRNLERSGNEQPL